MGMEVAAGVSSANPQAPKAGAEQHGEPEHRHNRKKVLDAVHPSGGHRREKNGPGQGATTGPFKV
jgi:hypothetical protein